jgi:hypothetical protein
MLYAAATILLLGLFIQTIRLIRRVVRSGGIAIPGAPENAIKAAAPIARLRRTPQGHHLRPMPGANRISCAPCATPEFNIPPPQTSSKSTRFLRERLG